MKVLRSLSLAVALALALAVMAACGGSAPTADKYDADVPTEWFDLYMRLVRDTPGFSPPVAARVFGYAGVTLYEAVVPGMPGYQSLAGQLNELQSLPQPAANEEYHWPTVANSALAVITRRLFPNASHGHKVAIDELEARFAREFQDDLDAEVFTRSVTQGRVVADAIYIWSLGDGGFEAELRNFPDEYTPPSGPGLWEPTPRLFSQGLQRPPLPALQPFWGYNRPFVLPTGQECDPGPPPAYSEEPDSPFYNEAREVYDTVRNLTPEQRAIALYWADDPVRTATPPGHSVSILTQVIRDRDYSLAVAAEAYAKVGMAVSDAFVACWYTKFQYNLLRPITYIQKVIDPNWNRPRVTDPVETPPFPEYTSGHSAQSAAAAQVLTDMFGDVAFVDHTHDNRGFAPRAYSSFFEAAQEAAMSRLYGGVHYRSAIENGLEQGKCVGKRISALKFRKDS